jgi:hypothetical protein
MANVLPVGADDKPAKVNHLRRFLFWATRFGVTNPRAISRLEFTMRGKIKSKVHKLAAAPYLP